MSTVRAIPVEKLRKAVSDPITAPKVTVVRCVRAYEHEEVNWMADQLVRQLQNDLPEVEVADLFLSTYRILSGVSNDPDDKQFDPRDQFPAVLEPILNSDMFIVAACSHYGLPHSNVVRLFERLHEHSREQAKEGERPTVFDGIPGAVLIHGGEQAHMAAMNVMCAINCMGCSIVEHGTAAWDKNKGKVYKSDEFGDQLDKIAMTLSDAVGD